MRSTFRQLPRRRRRIAWEGNIQNLRNEPDSSQTRYRRAGLLPNKSLSGPRNAYPLMRFPWVDVREALGALAGVTPRDEAVQLAYVNPETGAECMPVLGFSAIMLRPGETLRPPRRSSSAVLHCVEGKGEVDVDGTTLRFEDADTMAVPTHAEVGDHQRLQHQAGVPVSGRRRADAAQTRLLRGVQLSPSSIAGRH